MPHRKLLFVNSKYGFYGGVERYIYDTAGVLKRRGWECRGVFEDATDKTEGFDAPFESVCVGDITADKLAEIRGHGVKIAFVHKLSSPKLFEMLSRYFRIVTFVHDHDYYCLRRHKYFPITRKNCSLAYNPIVCPLCSGLVRKDPSRRLKLSAVNIRDYAKLLNYVRQSDICIVMSEFIRRNLVANGFDQMKTAKLYPVKYPADEMADAPQGNNLLYVGQIIRGKGVDLLVEAAAMLKSDWRLKIIGKGNDEDYVRAVIKAKGLGGRIEMIGWCDDVGRHYRQSNIVVVPSRWQEPFGMIGVEAFSYGRPVVGFDVGGISEWLRDGVNGLLAPSRDTAMLAKKTDELLADRTAQRNMGLSGYKMVKSLYSEDVFIEKFSSILGRLNV